MNWTAIKAHIGQMWGKTTTLLLGVGVAVQGILMDPGAQALVLHLPWLPKATAALGLAIVILRTLAPPAK